MTEQNQTYYHIQVPGFERDTWKKGDLISTSQKEYNAFYLGLIRDMEDKEFVNGNKIGLIEYSNSIFEKDSNRNVKSKQEDYQNLFYEFQSNSFEYEAIANKLHWSLFQYLKWIREEVFENVRVKIDSDLPSRKRCIWVSTKENVRKWWDLFNNKSGKRILELNLKGDNVFVGDGTLIKTDTFSLQEYESIAEKYWSGRVERNNEIEISYEGDFEVLNEFNDINELTF
jgi:hypothetical protein